MKHSPTAGIGIRLKQYRLLAGLTAQKLSDKLGGDISRGVIANIESGVKTDVTVDELIVLAWALNVPPVVLALPVQEPQRDLALHTTRSGHVMTESVYDLTRFFNGEPSRPDATRPGAAHIYSMSLLKALSALRRAQSTLRAIEREVPKSVDAEIRSADAQEAVCKAEGELQALGVANPEDLNLYY